VHIFVYISMPKSINGRRYFSASEVAQMAGVHRLTLLRWIREGRMADVSRDRNGWRMFSEADAAQIADYASSLNERTSPAQTLLFHNLPVPNHG
jgi:hypothetical protein